MMTRLAVTRLVVTKLVARLVVTRLLARLVVTTLVVTRLVATLAVIRLVARLVVTRLVTKLVDRIVWRYTTSCQLLSVDLPVEKPKSAVFTGRLIYSTDHAKM